jgi:hypothetical protein
VNKHFEEYAEYLEQAYGSRYTNKPMESGYLTHDGRWLKMGVDGNRADDHRGVSGIIPVEDRLGSRWPSVVAWMRDTKSIRWLPENCGFDIYFKPTKEQLDAILDMLRVCGELQVEQTSDSQNATEIFEYKRGGAAKLKKFISEFWSGKYLNKNPKLPIKWGMADGSPFVDLLREMVESQSKKDLFQLGNGIPLAWYDGKLVWWGRGKTFLTVKPLQGEIWIHGSYDSPTTAHALKQIFDNVPEWDDLEVKELQYLRGDGAWIGVSSGMNLKKYVGSLRSIKETMPHKPSRSRVLDTDYEYLALKHPEDVEWYHATLKKNLPSIQRKGLIPFGNEGWTPAWNWEVQEAVYLTSSLSYAAAIAQTIAVRNGEDSVVLRIEGRALTGKKLLADEDALRDDYDGSVNYGSLDTDFPDYVTSWNSSIRSLAVMDKIDPKFVTVGLTGKYVRETFDDETEDEESVEFSGPLESELEADSNDLT